MGNAYPTTWKCYHLLLQFHHHHLHLTHKTVFSKEVFRGFTCIAVLSYYYVSSKNSKFKSIKCTLSALNYLVKSLLNHNNTSMRTVTVKWHKHSMSNPNPVQQDDTCSSDSAHHNPLLWLLFHCSRLSQHLLWKTALSFATASLHSQRSPAYKCVASCNCFEAHHHDMSRFASTPPVFGMAMVKAAYTARKANALFG